MPLLSISLISNFPMEFVFLSRIRMVRSFRIVGLMVWNLTLTLGTLGHSRLIKLSFHLPIS